MTTGFRAETTSSSTGNYVIPNLAVGTYEVSLSMAGFKSWSREGIVVDSNANVRVDVILEVGQINERVTVAAEAPVLKTESTEVSSTMERKLVQDLPVPVGGVAGAMRNSLQLVMMLPQVRSQDGQSVGDDLVMGGGQMHDYNVSVDGAAIDIGFRNHPLAIVRLSPTLDAVQEFRLDTAAFKAEESRANGGMITIVSKSGTNQFHGDAFDYYQSQRLDANNWLNNKLGSPKSIYHRNDFGGTLAGPVYLPKLYNGKDKTFFVVSYEGMRQPFSAFAGQYTIPLPEMMTGNFSRWTQPNGTLIQLYDPTTTKTNPAGGFTRDPFAGNLIPANRLSPVASKMASYFPAPNAPGLVRNFNGVSGTSGTVIENALSLKLDQSFGVRNRLALTFTRNYVHWNTSCDVDPLNPPPLACGGMPYPISGRLSRKGSQRYGNVYRLNDTHAITPTVINTLILGFHRLWEPNHDVTADPPRNWGEILGGIKNNPGLNGHFPAVTFLTDNYYSWNGSTFSDTFNNVYNLSESIAWIKRSHSFKFGYSLSLIQWANPNRNNTAGSFSFSRLETARPQDNTGSSGSSFASFLLGAVDTANFSTGSALMMRYPAHAVFVQDDWKIARNLTANIGFRFEWMPAAFEKHDQMSYFDPGLPNPAANGFPGALRFVGSGQGRTGSGTFYGTGKGYGPRLGLAYQPTPNTVVRAGFGIAYVPIKLQGSTLGFTAAPSWSSADQGVNPAFYWDNGWPNWTAPPFIDPGFNAGFSVPWFHTGDLGRLPTVTTWNFTLSRALPRSLVVEATYTGSKGTYLASNRPNYMQIDAQYASLGSLLNRPINDPAVVALGFKAPFPSFQALMGRNATLGQSLRMFPQYTGVGQVSQYENYSGNSTYNALIIKGTKRLSGGLSILTTYTWAKTLTDADDALPNVAANSGSRVGAGAAQNNANRRLEKSYSILDQLHQFKLTASYDLPFGKGRKFWTAGPAARIFGQWNFSIFSFAQSGFPMGVIDTGFNNFLNGGPARPNVLSSQWRAPTQGSKFDPDKDLFYASSAFLRRTNPALDPFGSAPRYNGNIRSFPVVRTNISLNKDFPVYERIRAGLRWEVYDLLNQKTWSIPTSQDLANNQFGKITNAAGNRTMQFSLKVEF